MNPVSKFGFTAIVIITPDGKTVLEGAESAGAENWQKSQHYHGDRFVELLDLSLKKFHALR